MTTLDAKIRDANRQIIEHGNAAAIADFFDENYVANMSGSINTGHKVVRGYRNAIHKAFSNLRVNVEILSETNNLISWRRTIRGQHIGAFQGFPATGHKISWCDLVVSRFDDGRITEEWVVTDLAESLLRSAKANDARHQNLSLVKKIDLLDLDSSTDLFADDFTWHYFNPKLPEAAGDYQGLDGLKHFFGKLGRMSNGRFNVTPVDARAVGDELVVTHVYNQLEIDHDATKPAAFEFDAVVVWRIVDHKLAEAWDIPSVYQNHPLADSVQ